MPKKNSYILANKKALKIMIEEMSEFIMNSINQPKNIGLIGIIKRGDIIASRVSKHIENKFKIKIPVGKIDINLYRDDLSLIDYYPHIEYTDIPYDINRKSIILIDDVFFTGRTVRSALNEITDFGRPKKIVLCTLVDRDNRELPIKPDFAAIKLNIPQCNIINVNLKEIDGQDRIIIIKED